MGPADAKHATQTVGAQEKSHTSIKCWPIKQLFLYMILNIPYPSYTIYRTYINVTVVSAARALVDTFINNFFYDLIYLGFTLTFPNFVVTSDMFQQKYGKSFGTKIRFRCRSLNAR